MISPTLSALDLLPIEFYEANLPVEIVKPYTVRVYQQFKVTKRENPQTNWPGIAEMADVLGLTTKSLGQILNEQRKSFTLELCDKIALHGDFSINEMWEDTLEWAFANPKANWPKDYITSARGQKTKSERKRVKA
jgi:DNA-binding XRE family transcriptional regulator